MTFSKLELYAQTLWHEPAAIVGNRQGLADLRDALTKLLEDSSFDDKPHIAVMEPAAYDGEGYILVLQVTDDAPEANHYTGTDGLGLGPATMPADIFNAAVAAHKSRKTTA